MANIDMRDAFFDALYSIAQRDKNVIFLTADMGAFSLDKFKKNLSKQFINVGVAEQNMVSVAAGLALSGKRVFVYSIAPFATMRCYEQIKVDISGMGLPVTVVGTGPGFAYNSDGATHHAVQDIAVMRALPRMNVWSPSDAYIASALAHVAYKSKDPLYVRLEKGNYDCLYEEKENFLDGLSLLKKGKDILIISTGIMVHQAVRLSKALALHSIDAGIVDLYRIKPINEKLLVSYIRKSSRIVTLEEHSIIGGIGSLVSEVMVDNNCCLPAKRFAIGDKYCLRYGSREWMHSYFNLDISSLTKSILNWYK